jgi:hypothetical protein
LSSRDLWRCRLRWLHWLLLLRLRRWLCWPGLWLGFLRHRTLLSLGSFLVAVPHSSSASGATASFWAGGEVALLVPVIAVVVADETDGWLRFSGHRLFLLGKAGTCARFGSIRSGSIGGVPSDPSAPTMAGAEKAMAPKHDTQHDTQRKASSCNGLKPFGCHGCHG